MDTLSHGLWGGVAVGRSSRASYWKAFAFGVAPDIFAFGPYFVGTFLGLYEHPSFGSGDHPRTDDLPAYIHFVYQYTHSLVIFALVFAAAWWVRGRRPLWEMGAWGLHILLDIPTHASTFFPTPFLWPFSDFTVNGIPWGLPIIFFPNVLGLVLAYAIWWRRWRVKKGV